MRYVKEAEPNRIQESSWGRIIQHIEGPGTFAAISPYIPDASDEENERRFKEMQQVVRSMGYGYIPMDSGYTYQDTGITEFEESLFIPKITKDDAMELGRKYQQESILFKDREGFHMIMTDTGAIDMTFQKTRGNDGQLTFDPEITKIAFSQLKRGSKNQRGRKFAYVPESRDSIRSFLLRARKGPNRTDAYRAMKNGSFPEDTPVGLDKYLRSKK